MAVELTSPVLGQTVGYSYTGPLEDWLLAEGYAKRTGYTGPGVANTGATDVVPANDATLASNREAPYFPASPDKNTTVANDSTNLTKTKFPLARFDFDAGGADADAPSGLSLSPATGPTTGGTVVTITGDNLAGVTSVTFDAVAGTALDTSKATRGAGEIKVTTPAGTAGAKNVVLVDPSGNATMTNAYTYA